MDDGIYLNTFEIFGVDFVNVSVSVSYIDKISITSMNICYTFASAHASRLTPHATHNTMELHRTTIAASYCFRWKWNMNSVLKINQSYWNIWSKWPEMVRVAVTLNWSQRSGIETTTKNKYFDIESFSKRFYSQLNFDWKNQTVEINKIIILQCSIAQFVSAEPILFLHIS